MPSSWLGVDIQSTGISLVELSKFSGQFSLQTCAWSPLPEKTIESGMIINQKAVVHSMLGLLQNNLFVSKQVILAIPDELSMRKIIQLSADLHPDEIECIVMDDVEGHIPYSMHEICVDFKVLGRSTHDSRMCDVLLVAAQTQIIQQRVDVITSSDLQPYVLEIESYARARANVQRNQCDEVSDQFTVAYGLALRGGVA